MTDANRAASQTHDLPGRLRENAEGRARAGMLETHYSPPTQPCCVDPGRRILWADVAQNTLRVTSLFPTRSQKFSGDRATGRKGQSCGLGVSWFQLSPSSAPGSESL